MPQQKMSKGVRSDGLVGQAVSLWIQMRSLANHSHQRPLINYPMHILDLIATDEGNVENIKTSSR